MRQERRPLHPLRSGHKAGERRESSLATDRPDVGGTRALRVQQSRVKTGHSPPGQIRPRERRSRAVSDSQADSAGSIPVTRSIREKRCSRSALEDFMFSADPCFDPCSGHRYPHLDTTLEFQKDAQLVPSCSPAVRSPVLPNSPKSCPRHNYELDVNGLNYDAAKRLDQGSQARASALDAEMPVRLTIPDRGRAAPYTNNTVARTGRTLVSSLRSEQIVSEKTLPHSVVCQPHATLMTNDRLMPTP